MDMKTFAMWYILLGLFTALLGIYRAFAGKQNTESSEMDVLFGWIFAWWFYLPTFIIRYIKYKINGKEL